MNHESPDKIPPLLKLLIGLLIAGALVAWFFTAYGCSSGARILNPASWFAPSTSGGGGDAPTHDPFSAIKWMAMLAFIPGLACLFLPLLRTLATKLIALGIALALIPWLMEAFLGPLIIPTVIILSVGMTASMVILIYRWLWVRNLNQHKQAIKAKELIAIQSSSPQRAAKHAAGLITIDKILQPEPTQSWWRRLFSPQGSAHTQ